MKNKNLNELLKKVNLEKENNRVDGSNTSEIVFLNEDMARKVSGGMCSIIIIVDPKK
jgi:ABC-type glutathione transport system ATPase component